MFAEYSLNSLAAQTAIVALGTFGLGIITLMRERWSTEAILFWICTLTIGVWLSAFTMMYSSPDERTALYWARLAYLGVPFIPSAFYHFTVVVLRLPARSRRLAGLNWLASVFFAAMILSSDALISGLYRYEWGYYPKYGWLSVPYLTFFFGCMLVTIRHYWVQSRLAKKGTPAYFRARILLVAFAIAYLGSIDYLPKFGFAVYPAGYFFIFCFLGMAARAIWRYRLVDLTPAFAAEQIVETMNDPLIVCDAQGKIRIVNRAFSRLFGYEPEEMKDRDIRSLCPDDSWSKQMFREGSLKDLECVFLSKNKAASQVALSTSLLASRDGGTQGYVIVARDITDRKKIELELKIFNETLEGRVQKRTEELKKKIEELEYLKKSLQDANKRLEALSELKDEFVSTVSHELRTPLTAIKEGVSLLIDRMLGPLNEEQGDFLRTVDQNVDRLTELINNMLDLSKIEAGHLRVYCRQADAGELITEMLQNYRTIAGKRVLNTSWAKVPAIFCDTSRTMQVLENLFSNAVKFTAENGVITLSIGPAQSGFVAISIEDDGIGISKEDIPRLFKKFSQVGPGRSRGTGLGLALCKELVEMQGGMIDVESWPGRGSRFTFTLPVYTASSPREENSRENVNATKS